MSVYGADYDAAREAGFFVLFRFHYHRGTRAGLTPDTQGPVWKVDEFIKLGIEERNILNLLGGKSHHAPVSFYDKLVIAFFGPESDDAYSEWREHFEQAYNNVRQRKPARTAERVFLLTAAFTEEWQTELEFHLLRVLTRRHLLCTVLVPPENYKWDDHLELQELILRDKDDYLGGFAIVWGLEKVDRLTDFARRLSKPVIFMDHNPPTPIDAIPKNVCYVSVDDAAGGKLAGQAALETKARQKRALVLSGEGKHARVQCFINVLKENGWEVLTSWEAEFNREKAATIARHHLTAAWKDQKPFDVIFCTADSITLGCFDAITMIENSSKHRKPYIIGYDGIAATKRLAENGWLWRIVLQDAREVARASIEQLMFMHEGKSSERAVLIQPDLFPKK